MYIKKIPFRRYNYSLEEIPSILKLFFKEKNAISTLDDKFKFDFYDKYPLFTSSARSSLYLYYLTHFKQGGGNVITSPLACSVAFAPALAAGFKIKFADINPESYNLDPNSAIEKIDRKTRFIQVIHIGGNPCDMKSFLEISRDYNIPIIEDCAQAFGAKYNNLNVGAFGDASAFTFTKSIQSISGGILLLKQYQDFQSALEVQNKMGSKSFIWLLSKIFQFYLESYNKSIISQVLYNLLALIYSKEKCTYDPMSSHLDLISSSIYNPRPMEAFICICQLSKFRCESRAKIAKSIRDKIKKCDEISIQEVSKQSTPSFDRVMITSTKPTNYVINAAKKRGIELKHLSEQYSSGVQNFIKNTEDCINYRNLNNYILSLPICDNMGENEIEYLCTTLIEIVED